LRKLQFTGLAGFKWNSIWTRSRGRRLGGPRSRRPKAQISKAQVMLPLTPDRDNRLFTKERRRNVAAVRRRLRISVEVGHRRAPQNAAAAEFPAQPHNCEKARRTTAFCACLRSGKVDKNGGQSLYTLSSARRRLARWRVREAPHCSHGDRTSGHARGHVRVPASKVRASAPWLWAAFLATFLGRGRALGNDGAARFRVV
jgi:hypothetical protein